MHRASDRLGLTVACLLFFFGCGSGPASEPVSGTWRAWLASPGGELPFDLQLHSTTEGWTAALGNGPEESIEVSMVFVEGDSLILEFPHYAARIAAAWSADGRTLTGEWRKVRDRDRWSKLPFHAVAGDHPRFATEVVEEQGRRASVAGRWRVDFESDDIDAVGVFENGPGNLITGTFRTATGDYRYLAGVEEVQGFKLSVFDGTHAFLFHATRQSDGSLAGDFWSSDTWHETWTATRDPEASLPDAFAQTTWTGAAEFSDLRFPDLEGTPRALDDPAFAGKSRILYVFGSWCPNCSDATEFMVELHERYAPRGLSILGLAFEATGDFERDRRQVLRYSERHGVNYPLLIAGLRDKAQASEALPILDRVRSYPTTLFVNGKGEVEAVHSGFDGPATGEAHALLRERFTSIIESMLKESTGP